MLNFAATIKKRRTFQWCLAAGFLALLPRVSASAAESGGEQQQQKASAGDEKYSFFATARLLSPDRKTELSASEVRVNLLGNTSAVLKGRGLSVTLESEPNGFRKTQMVRIAATGGTRGGGDSTAALQAGMFRLNPSEEHSFLYTDKPKGWILEVRLRPVQLQTQLQQRSKIEKPKSPVRALPRKPKRLPA
ncbi:MAG: hypothetical protein RIR26_2873 [Pseudomonadota bacterium]|jgi:hypothetical protein